VEGKQIDAQRDELSDFDPESAEIFEEQTQTAAVVRGAAASPEANPQERGGPPDETAERGQGREAAGARRLHDRHRRAAIVGDERRRKPAGLQHANSSVRARAVYCTPRASPCRGATPWPSDPCFNRALPRRIVAPRQRRVPVEGRPR